MDKKQLKVVPPADLVERVADLYEEFGLDKLADAVTGDVFLDLQGEGSRDRAVAFLRGLSEDELRSQLQKLSGRDR